jgi:hypothetical protein
MITITREPGDYGVELIARCVCGAEISTFVEKGSIPPVFPGPFPDDLECEACGRWYNGFGQEINPRGEFDPADAGERWDED